MRAGHSAAAGHRALAAVRDWRFEPARHGGKPHGGKPRGGEPVAVVHDVSIPLATAAPAEQVVRWRQEMDGLRERLAAGGGQEAYEEARRRVAEIAGAIGDGGSDLLARAVAQQAQAEAGLGLADAAVWHWHAAQNLAVEYRASDLAVFGAAGDLLDGHRLRQPGEGLRETSDPDRAPRKLVGAMPRYPRETARRVDGGPPDIAIIELIVDENGLPQAPVVLAGRSPTRLYAALEAVREWRFEPADRSGTAVPVLRRLKLPLTFTIPIEEMALVRDADRLVRLAVKVAGPRPRLAGCYWRTARSLEPALAIADPSSLGPAAAALAESAALPRDRWSLDASADGVGTGTGPSPIAVGGDVEYPHKIYLPQPQYSPEALRARIQGTVITQMFTDEEGYVSGLEVLTGLPKGLNVEVARAFCQGRFEPTTRAGKRVRVFFVETANFRVR
jgi:outer membrane biosynthesis protein TonB